MIGRECVIRTMDGIIIKGVILHHTESGVILKDAEYPNRNEGIQMGDVIRTEKDAYMVIPRENLAFMVAGGLQDLMKELNKLR